MSLQSWTGDGLLQDGGAVGRFDHHVPGTVGKTTRRPDRGPGLRRHRGHGQQHQPVPTQRACRPRPFRDAMVAAWKDSYPDMTVSKVKLDGTEVTKGAFGEDAIGSIWYIHDGLVYDIESYDEALATTILAALPPATAPSAPAASASRPLRPERPRHRRPLEPRRSEVTAETYTHGHHESVLRSHRWRTAANSAAYLLPAPSCRDRTCSTSAAVRGRSRSTSPRLVAPGRVIGIDAVEGPLGAAAADAAAAGVANVSYAVGDVYALGFDDGRFDVVHAHQVLQHLAEPVAALREMGRVCRPGRSRGRARWRLRRDGLVPGRAASSTAGSTCTSRRPRNGGEPDAGRRLLAWAHDAGFERCDPIRDHVVLRDPRRSRLVGDAVGGSGDAARHSPIRPSQSASRPRRARAHRDAWHAWAASPDGWFIVPSGRSSRDRPDPPHPAGRGIGGRLSFGA